MKKNKHNLIVGILTILVFCLGLVNVSQASNEVDLKVSFIPVEAVVSVGEAIRFKVNGNKTFYLYLFSISENGEGYLLLPNKLQQYNVYEPNKDYLVPEKELEFFSDAPGIEEVIMVASTEKLELNQNNYKSVGQFYSAKSEVIRHDVKALRVRSQEKRAQQVIENVKIVVTGAAEASSPTVSSAVPFVVSDKHVYKNGEQINITYGADKSGFIYLWYVAEGGDPQFLAKNEVDGERFGRITGTAEAPFGNHLLVAVWNEKGDLEEDKVDLKGTYESLRKADADKISKGISLGARPNSFAVYELTIIE